MQRVRFNSPLLQDDLSGKLIQFVNARVLRDGKIDWDHVWVRDGKIIDGDSVFYDEQREADFQVNCEGHILSPGFIDIQINGAFGIDFSTLPSTDEEYCRGLEKASRKMLSYGVTSFVPTIITSPPQVYAKLLPLLYRRDGSPNGAGILGAHLEGPFISPLKKGCHPKQHIRDFGSEPISDICEVYGNLENVCTVTIAPELKGSETAIKYLADQGILVSLGHSSAGLIAGERGIAAGARALTHLFNAMQSFHHRDPCLIGLLTSKMIGNRAMYYGIITDGIHTHDSALRLAYRTNREGLIIITDAIAALGMEDGVHKLGDCVVKVNGLHATLDGTDTTAGSVASMPYCIRHLAKAVGCPLEDALICATEKPATLMGVHNRKGAISIGLDADLVLITEDVDVLATYLGGRMVYEHNDMCQ